MHQVVLLDATDYIRFRAWSDNLRIDAIKYEYTQETFSSCAGADLPNPEFACNTDVTACSALPTGSPTETFVGISTLDRNVNEWLSDANTDGVENLLSAYVVMESTNKAFVITRNASPGLYKEDDPATTTVNIANPVEGMVVWDTTKNCLSLYKVDETGGYWSCVNQGCNQ